MNTLTRDVARLDDRIRDLEAQLKFSEDRLQNTAIEKQQLEAQLAAAKIEIARCHHRLEIDRHFVPNETGDDLVEKTIPYGERSHAVDGIFARDETIRMIEAKAAKLWEELDEYIAARDAYEEAIKPSGAFGSPKHLKPNDPIIIRYREARKALAKEGQK